MEEDTRPSGVGRTGREGHPGGWLSGWGGDGQQLWILTRGWGESTPRSRGPPARGLWGEWDVLCDLFLLGIRWWLLSLGPWRSQPLWTDLGARAQNLKEHLPPQLAVGKEEVCYRPSRLKYMLICTQAQLLSWGKAQARLPGWELAALQEGRVAHRTLWSPAQRWWPPAGLGPRPVTPPGRPLSLSQMCADPLSLTARRMR